MTEKKCRKCSLTKAVSEFHKRSAAKDGLTPTCKACNAEAYRRWKEKDVEAARERWRQSSSKYGSKPGASLRRKLQGYGLSEVEFLRMQESHEGRCGACGDVADLVIDHDHETGVVRGLLCNPCNKGLGFFRDDPARLRAGIEYLNLQQRS